MAGPTELPAKMVGYIRVSRMGERDEADESFISVKTQSEDIEAWGRVKGVEIVWYRGDPERGAELDQSGGKEDRPVLEWALSRIESDHSPIGGIVVARLDRLSRRLKGALEIFERVEKAGGQVACVDPQIDSATSSGRLQRDLMLLLAEWELSRIREQWERADRKAVERGVHVAAEAPFGYRRRDEVEEHQRRNEKSEVVKDARLVRDPVEGPLVERAFKMYAREHASLQKIADMLNAGQDRRIFDPARVGELLDRRTYLGETGSKGTVNRSAHERLVSEALFAAVKTRRQESAKPRPRPNNGSRSEPGLLVGLVRCAGCGYALTSHWSTNPQTSKRELGYICKRKKMGCPAPAYGRAHLVDGFVLETLSYDWEGARDSKSGAEARFLQADRDVKEADRQLNELASLEVRRSLGEERWKKLIADAKQELDAANAALDAADAEIDDPDLLQSAELVEVNGSKMILPEPWQTMSVEAKRRWIRRFVKEVRLSKADGRGRWHRIEDRVRVRWIGGGFADNRRVHEKWQEAAMSTDDFADWLRRQGSEARSAAK